MEQLAVASGFDVHDYRSKLKLQRQDGDAMTLSNRSELACPSCGERFERLFVTEDEQVSFGSAPDGPICVVRAPEQLLVLTH